jgi:hypothetical protein
MDFGALEVQIFVSLALVLGAVFVALITDFLKGNNEALRERNIELVVRQEERERYVEESVSPRRESANVHQPQPAPEVAPHPAPMTAAGPVIGLPEEEQTAPVMPDPVAEPICEEWATEEELSEVDAIAERIRSAAAVPRFDPVTESTPPRQPAATSEEALLDETVFDLTSDVEPEADPFLATAEAPAETPLVEDAPLTEEVVEEAEEVEQAVTEQTEEPEPAPALPFRCKVTPIDVMAAERNAAAEALRLARELQRVADLSSGTGEADEPAEEPQMDVAHDESEPVGEEPSITEELVQEPEPEPVADEDSDERFDWHALDETDEADGIEEAEEIKETADTPVAAVPMPEPATERRRVTVPIGFQSCDKLSEALSSEAVFEGTAVSITVNRVGGDVDKETIAGVLKFVGTLLTPSDFACQSSGNEFLLLMPEETGPSAQRRLQYLSQRLWDFQIRSVGNQTIMFSWGAAEVSAEPLRDAIAAARDRMLETKRNRERATSEIHHYRLRAAND